MKRRLMNPSDDLINELTREQTAVETDDNFEREVLLKEHEMLAKNTEENTRFIEEKIIPRLEKLIREEGSEFSSYHLWDEFNPDTRRQRL